MREKILGKKHRSIDPFARRPVVVGFVRSSELVKEERPCKLGQDDSQFIICFILLFFFLASPVIFAKNDKGFSVS